MDDKKLRELERILDEPEPNVIVNRDGSCTPVGMSDTQARALELANEYLQVRPDDPPDCGLRESAEALAIVIAAEGLRQRLAEHKRGCTVRLGSCSRCIELGDEESIKIAQRQLAATQPGATGEEGQ